MAVLGDILRNRMSTNDAKRLALVVQGGGMRGVYSMGALAEIEAQNLSHAFDVIVGSSAGAINAAYLLAGQAEEAVSVYVDFLSNKKFVNLLRFNRIVDIDYLVDDVLKRLAPLNVDAIKKSPTLLEVVVTDAATAEPVIFTSHDDDVDFYELIRATAALPGLYDRQIRLRDGSYIDGGIADGVPVLYAAEAGADEIIAVVTRAPGFRRNDTSPIMRTIGRAFARRQSHAVREKIGKADEVFNSGMDLLEGLGKRSNVRTWTVWPSDERRLVGRTTTDKTKLRQCADMGREDMRRVLASSVDRV